jgi:hypothetical protein
LAKWQAIPEPIIPDPITATFLIVRFIRGLYLFLLEPNVYREVSIFLIFFQVDHAIIF